ncbi:DUF481 domain-containing protein [Muriicola sp.]|uniref:DUF481 domain-containing protein n=1 Tax=Muriicola sp. TaxID=2020856 RepID=UPI003C790832
MNLFKLYFFLLTLLCFIPTAFGQLVNIESQRIQVDSIRFVLKSDLLFDYSNNNGDYLSQFTANLATQIKSKDLKRIYMFIGSYNTERSKDQDFQNSYFLHLRYNQKITKVFRFEAFIQNQYNALLTINNRKLIGAGLRLKFISTPTVKAYFGNAYMYELEKLDTNEISYYNNRNSSYVSFSVSLPKSKVIITETLYFQPKYSDLGNYRIFQQLQAQFPISTVLSFTTQFTYFYNSFVPGSSRDYSSDLSLGLSINI